MSPIAIIFGGPSGEHDVSVVSAKNIYQSLEPLDFNLLLLGLSRSMQWKLLDPKELIQTDFENPLDLEKSGTLVELKKNGAQATIRNSTGEELANIDLVFPIIHGPYGEDGQLQKLLNELGIEFVGSDEKGCQNCMDKEKTKKLISEIKINQAQYLTFEDHSPSFEDVESQLGLPFFVKPARMGSSVGISKVSKKEQYDQAVVEAKKHDSKIVIEQNIKGRELECAILETHGEIKVSQFLSEIVTHHEFYSYESKYIDPNGAKIIVPAIVSDEVSYKIRDIAKQCYKKLGCRDYCRADFFLTENGDIYFNEINTHPGFTSISQFPQLWAQEGVPCSELVQKLLEQARNRK